jgi:hypothetical protein
MCILKSDKLHKAPLPQIVFVWWHRTSASELIAPAAFQPHVAPIKIINKSDVSRQIIISDC